MDDPAKGTATLDRAIALKPDFVAARAARGILLYSQNKPEAAVLDLEFAVKQLPPDAPERASLLDRLGQTYIALNRLADAVADLRKAAQLAPDDATTQLHLANALAEAGQTQESDTLMERFRQMNPGGRTKKVQGVVDYLSMTPAERHELYRTRLEKTVQDHPDDSGSQLLYLKYLLSANEITAASAVGAPTARSEARRRRARRCRTRFADRQAVFRCEEFTHSARRRGFFSLRDAGPGHCDVPHRRLCRHFCR